MRKNTLIVIAVCVIVVCVITVLIIDRSQKSDSTQGVSEGFGDLPGQNLTYAETTTEADLSAETTIGDWIEQTTQS